MKPFEGYTFDRGAFDEALRPLILSASGWRKVFAPRGEQEGRGEKISPEDALLGAAMAEVFADFLEERGKSRLLLGIDTRPTGPSLADVMLRCLLSRGLTPAYLFIVAVPEILAFCKDSPLWDGFIYISASHNPIGYNGVKFGRGEGVLGGKEIRCLIHSFQALLGDEKALGELRKRIDALPPKDLEELYRGAASHKAEAYRSYRAFSGRVISGEEDPPRQEALKERLKGAFKVRPFGVVAELNGSARTLSIDREFLESLGVQVEVVNGRPREITHAILPEGPSLDLCRQRLEELVKAGKDYRLGYVPDNDGDRGNLVYYSEREGRAKILEAQEVFALSVLGELSTLYALGKMRDKTAVVVNGPTSLRIDAIAGSFGCEVFRSEVGEANVVNLAQEKRREGWLIPILGEGSNGGNITPPAAVRDPLNTLGTLVKLLALRSSPGGQPGPFEIWCYLREREYRSDYTFEDILDSLPPFSTTAAHEDRALMEVRSRDQEGMKTRYEAIFLRDWEEREDALRARGIEGWEEWNQEGTVSRQGMGGEFRTSPGRGGLTIRLLDGEGRPRGFLWMRQSGTEPVFRVMADWEGKDSETEAFLLDWQRSMISRADQEEG